MRRPGGVVLLSVLLILALLSALAWQLMGKHGLVIAQSRFMFTADQSLNYALGAETFARQVLFDEWRQGGPGKDTLLEAWAQPTAPFEIDNGLLEVRVRDLHRCFNLNSLAGSNWQQNLERLKTLLRNRNLPENLAEAWKDWVDADQEITGFGAEDGEYLLRDPPYRTADAPAVHVSELALIRDFEPDYWQAVEDVVCVLPTTELRINVNTAHPGVLAALSPNLSEPQMQAFTEAPRDYDDAGAVVTEFADLAGAVDALTVTSEYFEISVRARVDDGQTELTSVLHRDPASGLVGLVSRDLGRTFRSLLAIEVEDEEGA
jgi:general secretion pathway protein K